MSKNLVILLGLSVVLIFAVRFVALKLSIYDKPGDLKIHKKPIPYLGGVGVFIALSFARLYFNNFPFGYFILALFPLLIGLGDDIFSVRPLHRFLLESVFAFILILIGFCFSPQLNFLSIFFTYLFFMGMINAVNWMDGMDGLLAGISIIVSLGFWWLGKMVGHPWIPQFATVFIVTLLAFLVFNFHPAKMFLGDAGSYLIGFTFFFMSIGLLKFNYSCKLFLTILAFLGVFIVDSTIAVLRRIRHGQHPFHGDRSHIYDQLYKRTGKYMLTVFVMYLVAAIGVVIGILTYSLPNSYAIIFWSFSAIITYALFFRYKFISIVDVEEA